jgi:leader peptidase (prepilin peptidase)/N-methyltransferase
MAVDVVEVMMLWAIMSVLVVIVVYDLRHLIIPDELVVTLVLLTTARAGYWAWLYLDSALPFLATAVAGLVVAGFFFLLWYLSGGRWLGFGDVKLSFPLALLVGSSGAFSMVVLSFWVGAGVSLCLLGLSTLARRLRGKTPVWFLGRTLTMKSAVPFAPFLVAGALVVFFYHVDVLALFSWNAT